MKIDRLSRPSASSKRRGVAASGADAGEFARALADVAPQPSGGGAATPVQTVNALLALQEVGNATAGPSRGRQRAEDILDRLEELRLALTFGLVSDEKLEQLAGLLRQREESIEDPKLSEIVNEIEIRAAVELAKRGR